MQTTILLLSSLGLLYVIRKGVEYRRAIASVGDFPGYRTILSPWGTLGYIIRILLPKQSARSSVERGFTEFQEHGWDAFTNILAYPNTSTIIVLADPAAIKEVTGHRARFPKPVEQYRLLRFWGNNIVASAGEEWKRYRKITAPSFSERNNKLVWDETVRIVLDLFDAVWKRAPEVTVDHALDVTLPIALFIISVAGFGKNITWADNTEIPPGHKMSFKESLNIISKDLFVKLIVPSWAMGITARTRRVRTAFNEVEQYMMEMVQSRRSAEKKEERSDLFTSLLDAGDQEGDATLTDRELLSNTFIFMLAGHETTAHTLCFTFAYLALYPEEQMRLCQDIRKTITTSSRIPAYEEMSLFAYSMAVFYETLRLMPPIPTIPKRAAEDTTLAITNQDGGSRVLPVPRGAFVNIFVPGVHKNPRFWDEPDEFKPSRFLGDWPRDAFVPFSQGPRACIGRRFFETEGIAILTMLVSQYKIEIKEEPQFANETFEERKTRVLKSKPGLTTTPVCVPLTFKRRD